MYILNKLYANKCGATAVEFALIAPIFFGVLFSIIETGIVQLKMSAMEIAIDEARRIVRTGQLQASGGDQISKFKNAFCSKSGGMISCSNVYFDVRSFSSFDAVSMTSPLVKGAIDSSKLSFNTGAACNVVAIRAYYPVMSPIRYLTASSSNPDLMNGGKILLSVATAFRNEPFGPC